MLHRQFGQDRRALRAGVRVNLFWSDADAPPAVEGQWPYDRTVLLRFPSREDAEAWSQSPQYQEIAKHRIAGTTSNIVYLDGLPPRKPAGSP